MRVIVWLRRLDYRRRYRLRHPGADMTKVPVVYYLHLGKTGGSFLKKVLRDPGSFEAESLIFVPFGHNITLTHLPRLAEYVFATRDPISRFTSGFYSRKRKGMPASFRDWTRAEARAFGRFPEANDLAEALDAAEPSIRSEAQAAMRAIRHVREFQRDWFPDPARLTEDLVSGRAHRLCQESLNADLARLCAGLGIPLREGVLQAYGSVHANSYDRTPPLSDRARANLRAHYAADIKFLAELDQLVGSVGKDQPDGKSQAEADEQRSNPGPSDS